MPVNGFSVGKDVSLSITNPNGNLTTVGLTSFTSKPMFTDLKSKRISDGKTYFGQIPDGWSGSFKFDRLDPSVDIFFANAEAGYYSGLNNPAGTIQQIVTEASGSPSTWRYDGVVLKLDDPGDWKADARVEQTISFNATTKVRVS
jgi:hypothetical protein